MQIAFGFFQVVHHEMKFAEVRQTGESVQVAVHLVRQFVGLPEAGGGLRIAMLEIEAVSESGEKVEASVDVLCLHLLPRFCKEAVRLLKVLEFHVDLRQPGVDAGAVARVVQ